MENKNFILIYKKVHDLVPFEDLMEIVLENKSELDENEECYVNDPDQYHNEIVNWVNECFDIEYDKFNLLNIIYPIDKNNVDFLNHEDDISDELKIKYFLKYWEDIPNES